jgi:hypothetical protein
VAEVFNSFELIFTKDADGHYTVMDSGECVFLPIPHSLPLILRCCLLMATLHSHHATIQKTPPALFKSLRLPNVSQHLRHQLSSTFANLQNKCTKSRLLISACRGECGGYSNCTTNDTKPRTLPHHTVRLPARVQTTWTRSLRSCKSCSRWGLSRRSTCSGGRWYFAPLPHWIRFCLAVNRFWIRSMSLSVAQMSLSVAQMSHSVIFDVKVLLIGSPSAHGPVSVVSFPTLNRFANGRERCSGET